MGVGPGKRRRSAGGPSSAEPEPFLSGLSRAELLVRRQGLGRRREDVVESAVRKAIGEMWTNASFSELTAAIGLIDEVLGVRPTDSFDALERVVRAVCARLARPADPRGET